MWKFCGKAQFPHDFGQFARNYAETVPFDKISTPGNWVKIMVFFTVDPRGIPLIRSVQALKVVFIFTVVFCFSSSCKLNLKHISQNHMHEVSFAINTSKFIVTKTLQRSISIVPAKLFLSS